MPSRRQVLGVVAAGVLGGCSARSDDTEDSSRSSTTRLDAERVGPGPGYGGVEATMTESLGDPPTGRGVAWTVPVGSPITARPVIVGDTIYLGSGQHEEGGEPDVNVRTRPLKAGFLHAVQVDGEVAFSYRASAPVLDVAGVGRTAGDGGGSLGVYAIVGWYGGAGGVRHRLMRVRRGRTMWSDRPRDENRFVAAATDRTVVAGTRDEHVSLTGERLTALGRDGVFRWRRESGDVIAGVGHGTRVYLTVGTRETWCLDAETGRIPWRYRGTPPSWTPQVRGGRVFLARTERTEWGGHPLVALDAETGDEDWRFEGDESRSFTPTGSLAVRSESTSESGAETDSSMAGTADTVVCVAGTAGALYALANATGERRWRFPFPGRIDEGPIFAAGTVYLVSTEGVLYAIDADTGTERWRNAIGLPGRALTAGDGGVTVVGATNGRESGNRYRVLAFDHAGSTQFRHQGSEGLLAAFTDQGRAFAVTEGGHLVRFAVPKGDRSNEPSPGTPRRSIERRL